MRDTRVLSLAAKGGWTDIICMLHSSSTRGRMTLPVVGWARVMGASVDQAEAVLTELEMMQVADIERGGNGDVTVSSRRMLRESITREQTRLRVQRHRRNAEDETGGNANETGQKTETKKLETKNTGEPSARAPEFRWVLPDPLNTPEVREAWQRWLVYWADRCGGGKAMPEMTMFSQTKKMLNLRPEEAIAWIENAIAKGLREPCEPYQTRVEKPAPARLGLNLR